MSLNRLNLYVVLKHSFPTIQQWPVMLLGIKFDNGDIFKGIKHPLFVRFLICHTGTGSFWTCFALLKLRTKDSIKQKSFGICHLYGMIFCFEIENTMIYVEYFILNFICFFKAFFFFFNHLPLCSYDIVCCSLLILAWSREINILYFLDFSYVTSSRN